MIRLILLALVALTSCTNPYVPLGPDFGASVNANIAAQVVNPFPAPPGPTLTDGQRLENAYHRYETNKVYQPHPALDAGQIVATPTQMP
jgi:hypothetical protein